MMRFAALVLVCLCFGINLPLSAETVVNDITQLNPIAVNQVVFPTSIEEVSKLVASHEGPISIGGGRFSQGGQTATENALFLDMRNMNRIINLDVRNKIITVQPGITWREIQQTIDPENLSLRIMQSFSNFTVGGSLSVNAHGRYVGEGPIIHSVESIKLVMADGSVKKASRKINRELFNAAIGGYGGIGVIVEATLKLTNNTAIERTTHKMSTKNYEAYFTENVANNANAIFHNANLYPPDYTNINAVTWYKTDKKPTVEDRLASQNTPSPLNRSLMKFVTKGKTGKEFREYVYDPYMNSEKKIVWRNYEASYDVMSLEPESRSKSTYALQEFFIPMAHFDSFVPKLADILKNHDVNVLNISIRQASADHESLLSWAPDDMFAFVIYYQQGTDEAAREQMKAWVSEMIDAAIGENGSYYLPYQIVATKAQFLQAYPHTSDYFALKKRVDPTTKFRNKLWDAYYGD